MNITIHRGSNQIGGCITEYEYCGWRLFVDFGEQLPGAVHKDIPLVINGLTHGDMTKSALLITHYHGDHIGKLSDVATDIPVYMGYDGCEIYRKLQCRLSHIQGEIGDKARKTYDRLESIIKFKEKEEFQFGPFSIRPIKMDHSAFDSYGFIISTTDKAFSAFHTGDFRTHGLYGEEFLNSISSFPTIDVIVCEATNIGRCQKYSETENKIEERFEALFKEHKYNSVFVSSTNIDRLFGIYRAAVAADRIVLMDEYQIDILDSVTGKNDKINNIFESYKYDRDRRFKLVLDRSCKDTPRFFMPDKLRRLIKWKGFVLFARSTTQFENLMKSFPFHNSKKYISQWKGYVNPELPAFNEALFNILGTEYEYIHTSGHADINTLETIFDKINCDVIIPIHTENSKKFYEIFSKKRRVCLIADGETYSLTKNV